MVADIYDRAFGCAVGAAVGDALGMPLEFHLPSPPQHMVREMLAGRLPPGTFTDDTEMALALAESLLEVHPLDGNNLAEHFIAWYHDQPADVGVQTSAALSMLARSQQWEEVVRQIERSMPERAGNGSLMRCWPVALVWRHNRQQLAADSLLQSRITHPHPDCVAAVLFTNTMLVELLNGAGLTEAYQIALRQVEMPAGLRQTIQDAPAKSRDALPNTAFVRHTLESALWGVLNTHTFEEALVQVVNLGQDADTTGAVAGALAGAAYGLQGIPSNWREQLQGKWPLSSGKLWREKDFIELAMRLVSLASQP